MWYGARFKAACGAAAVLLAALSPVHADGIGQIKTTKGSAVIERNGQQIPARVGEVLQQADVVRTGADGAAGITLKDHSMIAVGPDTEFALKKFAFNATTHVGMIDGALNRGTLAVKSGKIVQQTPEAMKISTPSTVLAVRGTEFLVRVDKPFFKF